MTIRMLTGDCRVTLPTLEPGIAQSVITSPPYYGLRDYGTPPLVWGGDPGHAHEWDTSVRVVQHSNGVGGSTLGPNKDGCVGPYLEALHARNEVPTGFCNCGAWLGSLGLEPTPELYTEHIVECFRHVWRVLRDDGTLWLNMGDSYAGSGKGPSNSVQGGASQIGPSAIKKRNPEQFANGQAPTTWIPIGNGYKAKDLMMMPFRVAMALQADGWRLRSVIPWLKRNSMPESVTDRPSTSVEYVFLLAKSARYYWDADAVRFEAKYAGKVVTLGEKSLSRGQAAGAGVTPSGNGTAESVIVASSRNRRNGDWFFESWQGLMLDEQDVPLALVVNPQPFSGAHFATFPPKLVEPMVKASTRPGDTVLDPFAGAGTTLLVADRLGRDGIGCELSKDYSPMAKQRIVGDAPLFTQVAD